MFLLRKSTASHLVKAHWRRLSYRFSRFFTCFFHAKVRLGESATFRLRVIPVAAGGFCGTCPTRRKTARAKKPWQS